MATPKCPKCERDVSLTPACLAMKVVAIAGERVQVFYCAACGCVLSVSPLPASPTGRRPR